jgi:hypothetical protein
MRWVYLALLAALPSFAAHGQGPTSITLWCQSAHMAADDAKSDQTKPDPITGGEMIVNLQERTVSFNSFHVPIERADGTMVLFHGEERTSFEGLRLTVGGSIDLVTGGVSLTFEQVGNNRTWKLICRPLGLF